MSHSILILTSWQFSWYDSCLQAPLKGRPHVHRQAFILGLDTLHAAQHSAGPNKCTTNDTVSTYCVLGAVPGAGIINSGLALYDSQSSSRSH